MTDLCKYTNNRAYEIFVFFMCRNKNVQHKIVNTFTPITLSICFGCSKEPSHSTVHLSTNNL